MAGYLRKRLLKEGFHSGFLDKTIVEERFKK
jgi:hypothetical protein